MVRVRGVVPQNFLQGVLHPLNFCVDLCHLWEALLCKNILCVPCVLWKDTVCFVGAAETAAPPEIASVGGYFMNVGAWVWQDAIPSYKTSVLICAICGRLFSARRFCAFRAFCGRTPFALLVQQRLLHPLSLHLWEALLCKKILCVPCVLWKDTVCFVGAAETAAPPKHLC